jgi:hypothetical protein
MVNLLTAASSSSDNLSFHIIPNSINSPIFAPNTESEILARILKSDERELTPKAAWYLLSLKLPFQNGDRVAELLEKARAGPLTGAESQELDDYLPR